MPQWCLCLGKTGSWVHKTISIHHWFDSFFLRQKWSPLNEVGVLSIMLWYSVPAVILFWFLSAIIPDLDSPKARSRFTFFC